MCDSFKTWKKMVKPSRTPPFRAGSGPRSDLTLSFLDSCDLTIYQQTSNFQCFSKHQLGPTSRFGRGFVFARIYEQPVLSGGQFFALRFLFSPFWFHFLLVRAVLLRAAKGPDCLHARECLSVFHFVFSLSNFSFCLYSALTSAYMYV